MKFWLLTTTALLMTLSLGTPANAAIRRDLEQLLETGRCAGCNLSGVQLRNTNLTGADLRNADLRNADLRGASLRGADLRTADLRGAYLDRTDFRGANLQNANLRGTNYTNAYWDGADLSGTILTRDYQSYNYDYGYDTYYRRGYDYRYDPYYPYYGSYPNYRYDYGYRYDRRRDRYDEINRIYREVLGRNADNNGLRTWSDRLNSGWSLRDIRREIANSNEARTEINRIYRDILGRDADSQGLRTWTNRLGAGDSLPDIRRQIQRSDEASNPRRRLEPIRIQPSYTPPVYQPTPNPWVAPPTNNPVRIQPSYTPRVVEPIPSPAVIPPPVRIQPIPSGGSVGTVRRESEDINEIRRRRSTSTPVYIQPISPSSVPSLPAPVPIQQAPSQPMAPLPSGPIRLQPIR